MQRLVAAFQDQANLCAELGSPFTARLLDGVADRIQPGTALTDKLLSWPGELSTSGAALPIRLAGGLHALVRQRRDEDLSAAYADPEIDGARLAATAIGAMRRHEAFLLEWIQSPPQTNEVRRSTAIIATAHLLTARLGLPMVLSELGASAGLNLLWDRYVLEIEDRRLGPSDAVLTFRPDWSGSLPDVCPPVVADRAGVDLNPLDPVIDRQRLLSYIWADQTDRIERTEAALRAAERLRPSVTRADAIDWLASRLAERRTGHLHLVYHTITWQYLPAEAQAVGQALLAEAGAKATPDAPLAHFEMEADGLGRGAGLYLTLWPGGVRQMLGRADFHGRWVDWQPPAV